MPSDTSFPFACRQTLTGFLLAVSTHLSRKRPADTFLDFLTNSSSIVIVLLNELSRALMAPGAATDPIEAVNVYLEENPESNLAHVVDLGQQEKKLKDVADDILQMFLNHKAYNCEPVKVFLREILAGLVLEMTVQSCSKPEWINGWIVQILEEGEAELMNAIDAGMGDATASEARNATAQALVNESAISQINDRDTSTKQVSEVSEHKRRISKAENAMDEAMLEAKRLSELIAAEDARRRQDSSDGHSPETTTQDIATPTSSQSDLLAASNKLPEALEDEDAAASTFTSFDQIIPVQQPTALRDDGPHAQSPVPPQLTLHNANVSIFDDSQPGEKGSIRSKPVADYLLQIEPASSQHPGWMIARRYADFETLHEVLRRISVISGVADFAQEYPTIPSWKGQTKSSLRNELERYLHVALSYSRLAESEGMKRFLERDQGVDRSSPAANKGVFGFPSPAAFETMGKGMLDVLTSAPKGAAGGGKAILGGVTGVLGSVGSLGQKKPPSSTRQGGNGSPARRSTSRFPRSDSITSLTPGSRQSRESQESLGNIPAVAIESTRPPPLPARPSDVRAEQQQSLYASANGGSSTDSISRPPSIAMPESEGLKEIEQELNLPPPPSEIPDDYNLGPGSPRPSTSSNTRNPPRPSSTPSRTSMQSLPRQSTSTSTTPAPPPQPKRDTSTPLTEQETRVAIELFFATIHELYTLSSAWSLRLTLLAAAKTFLLRPGNPSLEAIRLLLQDTLIDANISDAGLALHLLSIRANALPTEEEAKASPPPLGEEEKEKLRVKARKLLVERGMPLALMSVMGAGASAEALGRVFDCLQDERVARGLVCALVLQGFRVVAQ